ncbi:phosphatase 2C-like domain-containing protein [Entophlyctis helioformis]|nr:phosphatase 2C-like domain-containing protein [Entophlyctis helioformis]
MPAATTTTTTTTATTAMTTTMMLRAAAARSGTRSLAALRLPACPLPIARLSSQTPFRQLLASSRAPASQPASRSYRTRSSDQLAQLAGFGRPHSLHSGSAHKPPSHHHTHHPQAAPAANRIHNGNDINNEHEHDETETEMERHEHNLPPGIPDMAPSAIAQRLCAGQSFAVTPPSIEPVVVRVDACELASNDPIEDAHFCHAVSSAASTTPASKATTATATTATAAAAVTSSCVADDGVLLGVMDGHWDVHCARTVALSLPKYMAAALSTARSLQPAGNSDSPLPPSVVRAALTSAFVHLDADLLSLPARVIQGFDDMSVKDIAALPASVRLEAAHRLMPALAGSCAVSAYITGSDLYVANAGDCRAILGSRGDDGVWHAKPLSIDHQPDTPSELEALRRAHPGEEQTVAFRRSAGHPMRVLGNMMPSRAFGDARFKWPLDTQQRMTALLSNLRLRHGWQIPQFCYTPPYITAKPDVVHHALTPADGFIVLASDGMFDLMHGKAGDPAPASSTQLVRIIGDFLDSPSKYRVHHNNAATHAIRVALSDGVGRGGSASDRMVSRMLTIRPAGEARSWRDDLTVVVAFLPAVEYALRDSLLETAGDHRVMSRIRR